MGKSLIPTPKPKYLHSLFIMLLACRANYMLLAWPSSPLYSLLLRPKPTFLHLKGAVCFIPYSHVTPRTAVVLLAAAVRWHCHCAKLSPFFYLRSILPYCHWHCNCIEQSNMPMNIPSPSSAHTYIHAYIHTGLISP